MPTVSLICSATRPMFLMLINLKTSLTPLLKKSKENLYLKPIEYIKGIWTKTWSKAPRTTPNPRPAMPKYLERKTIPEIIPKL